MMSLSRNHVKSILYTLSRRWWTCLLARALRAGGRARTGRSEARSILGVGTHRQVCRRYALS